MRDRPILSAVLFSAALFAATQKVSADVRAELGTERAKIIESIVAQLYPGSQLEWTPVLTLIQGTTRRGLRIGDIDLREDDGGGYTGVAALELTDDRTAINGAVERFETASTRSPADIVAFKATSLFEVTTLRRGTLNDPASVIEQVEDVELSPVTYNNVWPDVYVTYTGVYGTADSHGEIRWDEKLTLDPAVAAAGRAPQSVYRVDKKGPVERSDEVTVDVVDETTISFASVASGQVISNCADPCLPDGRVLLALWWTAAASTASP